MTGAEIVRETVSYYSEEPFRRRSTDLNGRCVYTSEDGRHCAFGRCMRRVYRRSDAAAGSGSSTSIKQLLRRLHEEGYSRVREHDDVLQVEYTGYSLHLWAAVQALHDCDAFWGVTGMTDRGLAYADALALRAEEREASGFTMEDFSDLATVHRPGFDDDSLP